MDHGSSSSSSLSFFWFFCCGCESRWQKSWPRWRSRSVRSEKRWPPSSKRHLVYVLQMLNVILNNFSKIILPFLGSRFSSFFYCFLVSIIGWDYYRFFNVNPLLLLQMRKAIDERRNAVDNFTTQQSFLMAKEIGAIQHAALQVWPVK